MKALGRIGKIATTAAVSALLIGAAATAANAATPTTPAAPATASAQASSTTPATGSPSSTETPAATPASRLAAQATAAGAGTSPRPASGQRKVGDFLQDWFAMVNNTPYVMHLQAQNTGVMWWDGSRWETEGWQTAPPQTLYPGQTATMAADPSDNMWVFYTFTDGQNNTYGFQGNDNPQNQVSGASYAYRPATGQFTGDISFFHVAWVPDTDQTIQAVVSRQDTIDASKNPGAAADAMTKLQPNNASNAFLPYQNAAGKPQIVYTQSAPVRASGELINNTDGQAVLSDQTTTDWNQSTSFTESLTYEAQVNLFGAIDTTLSAQFNSSQTLTASSSISTAAPTTLAPHQVGWLNQTNSQAQVTGTYTFIGTDGVTYHLLNVSVTLPSVVAPDALNPAKYTDTPVAMNCTAAICPAWTPGS